MYHCDVCTRRDLVLDPLCQRADSAIFVEFSVPQGQGRQAVYDQATRCLADVDAPYQGRPDAVRLTGLRASLEALAGYPFGQGTP